MYDRLAPMERVALIAAADARGDEVEQRRLDATAPVIHLRFADYLWPSIKINTLALIYLTEQLDALANYWHALWRLDDPTDAEPEDWLLMADMSAYYFVCNADAWRRFGSELNLDPDYLAISNYRGWLLQFCAQRMPKNAPTREALIARYREQGRAGEPLTADAMLQGWRHIYRLMTEGGDSGDGGQKP